MWIPVTRVDYWLKEKILREHFCNYIVINAYVLCCNHLPVTDTLRLWRPYFPCSGLRILVVVCSLVTLCMSPPKVGDTSGELTARQSIQGAASQLRSFPPPHQPARDKESEVMATDPRCDHNLSSSSSSDNCSSTASASRSAANSGN